MRKKESGAGKPERAVRRRAVYEPESRKIAYRILDHIGDGVYGIDERGYLNFMNKALMERRGIQREQYRHLHYLNLIDPTYHVQAKKNFERVMRGENGIPLELRFTDPGGRSRVVEVHSRPVREGGRVVGLLGISRDITARKQAEEQLWVNQEQLRLALRAGRQGYFDWEVARDRIYYSEQYLELLEYGRDELEPSIRSWKTRIHPQDKTAVLRTLQEHLDGRTLRYEATYRMRVKSGAWRWFRGHGEVVTRDAEGRPLRMMGTIADVTTYREFEEELERRVEDRTTELVEVNSALKVLLRQREQDKTDAEETMAANLKFMVLPYLNKLKQSGLDIRQKDMGIADRRKPDQGLIPLRAETKRPLRNPDAQGDSGRRAYPLGKILERDCRNDGHIREDRRCLEIFRPQEARPQPEKGESAIPAFIAVMLRLFMR